MGVKQVCYMQEIERTSDTTEYGRPISRQNGSSPSLHKRCVRRFRPLNDMFSEDTQRRSQLQTLGTGVHLSK